MSTKRTVSPLRERDAGVKTDPPGQTGAVAAPVEASNACLTVIRGRSLGLRVDLNKQRPSVLGRDLNVELPIEDSAASRRHG